MDYPENIARMVKDARELRKLLLSDPWRPAYHFAFPEDDGRPGDPNGAFFANGRYHLMFLYNRSGDGFAWGHASSKDLLHWRFHPDAIGPGDGDEGCFSGGAFVDRDGRAWLSYWGLWGARGICLASSADEHYDTWTKHPANPVIAGTDFGFCETTDTDGKPLAYGTADPSQIWEKDGRYYMLTGNLPLLNKFGRVENPEPRFTGDHLYLFVSDDLAHWEYLHEFYESKRKWTDASEDDMCPSFLPLPTTPRGGKPSGSHLLLYISHNKGCQYYIGRYDTKRDRFLPTSHGRMTWNDNAYFAPESVIDDKGRHVMWTWIFDDRPEEVWRERGWNGRYGLPRTLWRGEDGALRMAPVDELKTLRQRVRGRVAFDVPANGEVDLDKFGKELLELEVVFKPGKGRDRYGVKVCRSADGREETVVGYDPAKGALFVDTTKSGLGFGRKIVEEAPLKLAKGEDLKLRIFIDRGIVEVYANDRQAIARAIYPTLAGRGIRAFAGKTGASVASFRAWELMPSNPF